MYYSENGTWDDYEPNMMYDLETSDKRNRYIRYGCKIMHDEKVKAVIGNNNLHLLAQSKFVAIDTEGRCKITKMPIMIQITNGKIILIMKYQEYYEDIKQFLSRKTVFVFGGNNEFSIMKYTPPSVIETQLHGWSLKHMATEYYNQSVKFEKPSNLFYKNKYWNYPSRQHYIYAAFDVYITYQLGMTHRKEI